MYIVYVIAFISTMPIAAMQFPTGIRSDQNSARQKQRELLLFIATRQNHQIGNDDEQLVLDPHKMVYRLSRASILGNNMREVPVDGSRMSIQEFFEYQESKPIAALNFIFKLAEQNNTAHFLSAYLATLGFAHSVANDDAQHGCVTDMVISPRQSDTSTDDVSFDGFDGNDYE